jgi:proton glutamate symport protein
MTSAGERKADSKNKPSEKHQPAAAHGLTIAGLCLFLAGSLLPIELHALALPMAVRWAGLLALCVAGIRRRSLSFWIFLSILLGAELGFDRPQAAEHLRILSDIFLRLIKVIVGPLILATLIAGVAGHGDLKGLGRIGAKSLIYFEVVTTIALFLGVGAINLSRAGVGLNFSATAATVAAQNAAPMHWDEFLLRVFPESIVKSLAENQILQVAVFALIFGIALAKISAAKRAPVLGFFESLAAAMFSFTNIVMYFAPFGVGAAMAYTVGHMGVAVLLPLGKLLLTAYVALIVLLVLVYLPILWMARIPLGGFVKAVAEPAGIAFATSTSEAALPLSMEMMEAFGVPRRIVAFVIPAGYSFNLAGSALYLALASIFVAQAAGMKMGWGEQLLMVFTLMLTSKGVAGVPRAVVVVLLATAATFHLPTEPIFIILGVDALIDMGRTSVNVIGNCLACAVVARWEGELQVTAQEHLQG